MKNQFFELSVAMSEDSVNGGLKREFLLMQVRCAAECGLLSRHQYSTLQFAAECYYGEK